MTARKLLRHACKEGLTSDSLLVHYDLNRTLRLACGASSYGLGAILSHVTEDGQERPMAGLQYHAIKNEYHNHSIN